MRGDIKKEAYNGELADLKEIETQMRYVWFNFYEYPEDSYDAEQILLEMIEYLPFDGPEPDAPIVPTEETTSDDDDGANGLEEGDDDGSNGLEEGDDVEEEGDDEGANGLE